MRILAIDPGFRSLGWACSDSGIIIAKGVIRHRGAETNWMTRWADLVLRVESLVIRLVVKEIVIEEPQLFISSSKGSAAANSGAIMKLTALVYGIAGRMMGRVEVIIVPVRTWKGNLPKDITRLRVFHHWPQLKGEELALDTWDALGLLLWKIKHPEIRGFHK